MEYIYFYFKSLNWSIQSSHDTKYDIYNIKIANFFSHGKLMVNGPGLEEKVKQFSNFELCSTKFLLPHVLEILDINI